MKKTEEDHETYPIPSSNTERTNDKALKLIRVRSGLPRPPIL